MSYKNLVQAALEARKNAYVPYSRFPVGAALLTEDGTIVTGCNVENASFPLGCCAERIAVYTAVALGHRKFSAVAIVGGGRLTPPCGGCRQVLSEFGDLTVVLAVPSDPDQETWYALHDLLPLGFDSEALS